MMVLIMMGMVKSMNWMKEDLALLTGSAVLRLAMVLESIHILQMVNWFLIPMAMAYMMVLMISK